MIDKLTANDLLSYDDGFFQGAKEQ